MGPLVLPWSSTGPQTVVVRLSIYAWGVALKGQLTHRFVSNGEGFAVNEWVAVGFQYETYFDVRTSPGSAVLAVASCRSALSGGA